jgi:hypothetical protein
MAPQAGPSFERLLLASASGGLMGAHHISIVKVHNERPALPVGDLLLRSGSGSGRRWEQVLLSAHDSMRSTADSGAHHDAEVFGLASISTVGIDVVSQERLDALCAWGEAIQPLCTPRRSPQCDSATSDAMLAGFGVTARSHARELGSACAIDFKGERLPKRAPLSSV